MKNKKIVAHNFFVIFYTFLMIMVVEASARAKPMDQVLHWERWVHVGSLIFLLPVLIWVCFLTPLPILWGIRRIRERQSEKAMQKSEDVTEIKR
ncbi:hypothetical protein ABID23_000960 [Bartonella silvatica]|uniref:Uncharacterized protein n=1 Tax=Bartonella silvatica TaxID=357760 RepID=A0ABV2HH42_9HYPH